VAKVWEPVGPEGKVKQYFVFFFAIAALIIHTCLSWPAHQKVSETVFNSVHELRFNNLTVSEVRRMLYEDKFGNHSCNGIAKIKCRKPTQFFEIDQTTL